MAREDENFLDTYDEDEDAPKKKEASWLEKMGDAIKWKVIAPNFANPYQIPFSDVALYDLANNPQARLKACDLKCLCDGYEVMSMKNLSSPMLFTSHPCLSAMPRSEILEYINGKEIQDNINSELEKLKTLAQEELDRRQVDREKEEQQKRGAAVKKKPDKKTKGDGKGSNQARVIRM